MAQAPKTRSQNGIFWNWQWNRPTPANLKWFGAEVGRKEGMPSFVPGKWLCFWSAPRYVLNQKQVDLTHFL